MSDLTPASFRDRIEGVCTVDEHNKIVRETGEALWGWWKKPSEIMRAPALWEAKPGLGRQRERPRGAVHRLGDAEALPGPMVWDPL